MMPLIVSAGPQMGFESSSSSESSCRASFATLGDSHFSRTMVVVTCGGGGWGSFCVILLTTSLLLLFIFNDFRGGIGGASSCVPAMATTDVLFDEMTMVLFDICSTSIDGVLLLDVDEHVEDEDDGAEVDGIVVCVALTTIVFGAFPLIKFTFTTFTTVVLTVDGVVIIGFKQDDDDDGTCGTSVVLVIDDNDEVVGIDGTFLNNLGDVWGLWTIFSPLVSVKLLLSAWIDDSSKLNSLSCIELICKMND